MAVGLSSLTEKPRGTFVVFGGFDSYIEEWLPAALWWRDAGYDTIMFEGPGQGAVLEEALLPMTVHWEQPVKVVLDFYKVDDVTLMGFSLGGGLVIRAAAFEPRVNRVIAYDILTDSLYLLATRRPNFYVNGIPIRLVETPWNLAWFLCPRCSQRCRHLYLPEMACQRCLGLDWSSRHQHRSVRGLARLKWLRRRIGLDEAPFTPIPERPRWHTRYNRIADEIRTLEAQLVGHLTELNRVLERRILVRKAKGKW